MGRYTEIIDMIYKQNFELYFQLEKEFRYRIKRQVVKEIKQTDAIIERLKSNRNNGFKKLRDTYGFNEEAIKELRRATRIKNGMTKGYSLKRLTKKLIDWSPEFEERYNTRLKNYDAYTLRSRNGKTEPGDWVYEGYNYNRIDYAEELTRCLISNMKDIMRTEEQLVKYVCEGYLDEEDE